MSYIKYIFVGIVFGIVFVKAEIISWFRIQEMFQLKSFHMYGVIGSAVMVGALSVFIIKKWNIRTIENEQVNIISKPFNKGTILGSIIFGIGWALTGACPGPLFAHVGTGVYAFIVTLFFALVGTYTYGIIKDKLPH